MIQCRVGNGGGSGRRTGRTPVASEAILQTDNVVIDALVRPFDAAIGQMLIAVADVVLALVAKTDAGADMVAELEAAAELTLRRHRGMR